MFDMETLIQAQAQARVEEGKGRIISGILSGETPDSGEGMTQEGKRFLSLYEARLASGKAFARAGASLRELKSQETRAFWGNYAVLSQGFGGTENYKAPPYDEAALRERLKILGWKQKRLPSAYAVFCRKHKITLSPFQAACVLQEDAARKAARREDDISIQFPDSVLDFFVARLRDDDGLPLDKMIIALSKAVKQRLVQDGTK